MGSNVDLKKLKYIFVIALILVLAVADVACAAYLMKDDFKVITYNDKVEDDCYDGYRVEVVEAIEAELGIEESSSGKTSLPIDNGAYSSTSSKKTLNDISDEQTVVIFLVILDVTILLSGFLLYFVVKNAFRGKRGAVAGWSTGLGLVVLIGVFFLLMWNAYITTKPATAQIRVHAPIIYLYDEQCRDANVKLCLNGELTCTYPVYDAEEGWNVRTSPDGILIDENGRQYEYLFWEGDVNFEADFSKGFCVAGKDTVAFLEKALSDLGLSDTEANAFIMYWLPLMEGNPYNVISFQTENFENAAVLEVTPSPDTVVRINMLFYSSDSYVDMAPQDLSSMNPALSEREGFVLVEWGGGKIG